VNQVHGASNFAVIINYRKERTVFVQNVEREHDFQLTDVTTDMVYLTSLGNKWKEPYKKIVDFAREQKACLVFNPGSRQIHEGRDVVQKVLKHTNILILNKEEGEHLVHKKIVPGSPDNREYIVDLMQKLQKLGPQTIIMTNGRYGSYALDEKHEVFYQEMFPGEVVERTGAGDGFSAGFLAGAIHGECLPNAMQWGAINATSVVGQIGAQAGLLKSDEMKEFLHKS
jgi:sugar/nucleoside kinase (ribokinase family)